nr:MAG TPA: hypothetical protein [Caudoviricetes sp.]
MFDNEFLRYIPPIGEDLQHTKVSDDCTKLHSDIYLLHHIGELNVSNNLVDAITSRLQSVSDFMPDDLRQSFDKLDDFEKMEVTDSRYAQWVSDKVSRTKQFMKDFDTAVSKLKDNEETQKLKAAQKNLRDFILRLGSVEESDNS